MALVGVSSPFIAGYGWILRNREISTKKGELIPPDITINEPFEIHFGSNYIIALINELREGIELSRYIGISYNNETYKYPINIDIVDSKLLVSAVIRNKEGETIAKIKNNFWAVDPNPILVYDRNYNDFAFEVIDSDQNPVLQVIIREQNIIYIGGIFYTPRDTILVTPEGFF